MIIEQLNLKDFRNFKEVSLDFDSAAVIFEGANGQGKTSLLESIFYLANLRSFRTSRIQELKRIGAMSFQLSLIFTRPPGWKSFLEVEAGNVRSLQLDHTPVSKASDFTGKIKTVAFLPDDPLIINGPSILRRRFFDMFISMLDREYFTALQNYSSVLRSRNFLLKNKNRDRDILYSYSSVLADSGSLIVRKRKAYCSMLSDLMHEMIGEICPSLAEFGIRMRYLKDTEEKESYLKKTDAEQSKDIFRGFTSFGPHLDDFEFTHATKNLRSFGSRGQCRMASLVLKLAELEAVRRTQGALKDTVVLVDDATGDLDTRTKEAFLAKIASAGQTFFALTEVSEDLNLKKARRFRIVSGSVRNDF
ncbi:MAG: DNA replication and repair protein RecF [Lentisphaerae bacterium ADurb.Bin242]|nr:MAG: DNA replication and repair protein RecF [Lentisphaerae bacterium ADurb.Bin242]